MMSLCGTTQSPQEMRPNLEERENASLGAMLFGSRIVASPLEEAALVPISLGDRMKIFRIAFLDIRISATHKRNGLALMHLLDRVKYIHTYIHLLDRVKCINFKVIISIKFNSRTRLTS